MPEKVLSRTSSPHRLTESSSQPIQLLQGANEIRNRFPAKPINVTKPLNVSAPLLVKTKMKDSHVSRTSVVSTNGHLHQHFPTQSTATQTKPEVKVRGICSATQTLTDVSDMQCQTNLEVSDIECQTHVEVVNKMIQVVDLPSKVDSSTSTKIISVNSFSSQTLTSTSCVSVQTIETESERTVESELKLENLGEDKITVMKYEDEIRTSQPNQATSCSRGVNTVVCNRMDKFTLTQPISTIHQETQHSPPQPPSSDVTTQTKKCEGEEKSVQVTTVDEGTKNENTCDKCTQVLYAEENSMEDTKTREWKVVEKSYTNQSVQCMYLEDQGKDLNNNSNHSDNNSVFECDNNLDNDNMMNLDNSSNNNKNDNNDNNSTNSESTSTETITKTTNEVYVQTLHLTKGESEPGSLSSDVFEDERLQELHLYNDYKSIQSLTRSYRMSSSKSTQVDFTTIRQHLDTLDTCLCQKANVEGSLHSLFMLKDEMVEERRCGALKLRAKRYSDGVWYVCLRADVFYAVCQQVVSNVELLREVEVVEQHVEHQLLATMRSFLDNYTTLSQYFKEDEEESDDESFINGFRL